MKALIVLAGTLLMYSSTFIGQSAGIFNNNGSGNVFVGTSAGAANTTGASNTTIGHSRMFKAALYSTQQQSVPILVWIVIIVLC